MILTPDPVSFISKQKRGHKDEIAERQRERLRERESECRLRKDMGLVVKQTIRKYTCVDKMIWQHLAGLLLISKMRNLANDVSHD